MENRKVLWIVVILLAGAMVACGGGETPTAIPTPAATATPVATPTPSASEHVDRGVAYIDAGEFERAIVEFQAAIRLEPDNADAYRNLGTAYGELGRWEEAVAAYEEAVRLNPDYGEAYGDLVGAYASLGMLEEAIVAGQKAIELSPEYVTAYSNLGAVYSMLGRNEEAIALLTRAVQLDHDHLDAHYNLGYVYQTQGRWEQAIFEYGEVIRIDPNYAKVHVNLCGIYVQLERYDEAVAECQTALELDPTRAVAHKNLGVIYTIQGRIEEAIAEFQAYLDLAPDAPDRAQVEQEIARLQSGGGMVEYVNAAGGYGLSYPQYLAYDEDDTWVVFSESQEAIAAVLDGRTGEAVAETLIVMVDASPLADVAEGVGLDEDASPAEILQALAGQIEAELEEIESGSIGGYPAAFAEASGTFEGAPFEGAFTFVVVEHRLIGVLCLAPPGQWEPFRATFGDMLDSLSFFEPSS